MLVFVVLYVAAAACAWWALRCFAHAGRTSGVARLRWRYHGLFFVTAAAGLAALALLGRSPAAAIAAGLIAIAALAGGVAVRIRARRSDVL